MEEKEINEETVEETEETNDDFKENVKSDVESKTKDKKPKKNKLEEKINALEAENEKLKAEIANWKNEYLKAHADSQNFQKRINDQAIKDRKYASQKVISELINPIDMLVQIVNMEATNPEVKNYQIGFKMIADQLITILKNEGLAPIEVKVGDEFKPEMMQAVETSNLADFANNQVTKVMQPGYMYKDRVLRPAMVIVNKLEENKEDKGEN